MPLLTEVSIRKNMQIIQCDAGELDLDPTDRVLVETEHGPEVGLVCQKERFVKEDIKPEGKIVRILGVEDIEKIKENRTKEQEAIKIVHQKIEDSEIEMHLTTVEFNFDRTKLFVYYTAENRVDFRDFIKSLGHILRTRIQMVQIGVRDETKMLGGLGICGRAFCCASFLRDFSTITIDMAKHQDIALNIQKLSGHCGRLLCCLNYEENFYVGERKKFPRVGSNVSTPQGTASVVSFNCLSHDVAVKFSDGVLKTFKLEQIKSV